MHHQELSTNPAGKLTFQNADLEIRAWRYDNAVGGLVESTSQLRTDTTALILVHNHPSGDPEPSEADIAMTKEVEKACGVLGLTLHDHIIVGAGREVSLRGLGHL